VRKLIAGIAATAAAAGVSAAPSAAQTAEYGQKLDKSCCSVTLEPGDVAPQFLSFTNTGTKTWFSSGAVPVRLGASNPNDRTSPFFDAADWIAPNRPTALDQAQVAPGQIGTFSWILKAPQPGSYREYYAPVAEGVTWMAPTDAYHLDYTVLPAQPPVLTITGASARVRRGEPILVMADATDNRGVARVTFTAGTATATTATPKPGTSVYGAALSSAALGAGTHNVLVRAYDLGGRESSAVAALEIYGPAPPAGPAGTKARLRSFKPLFVTRAGAGEALGTFDGIGDVVGARRGGILRVLCVRGCARRVKVARRVPRRGSLNVTLGRALPLRRSTRIELQLTAPGFVTRYQRYRFERRPEGTRAHQVGAGCLARKQPRRTTTCPRT
jgi:Bacterial Ig domain